MVGNDHNPGFMVRALSDLFDRLAVPVAGETVDVNLSFLECYNESLRDLLTDDAVDCDLREDGCGNAVVVGQRTVPIASAVEVMSLLKQGNRRRTQEATAANQTSSRSHAILEVRVQRTTAHAGASQQSRTGKLFLIDLAGSERAAQTKNTGQRMVEGQHINRSLLALGNCINALGAGERAKYVNFRDSKLTRLLKESLDGRCRTLMICCASPASFHFEETYNTLNYANRAKNIKTTLQTNDEVIVDAHIAEYQAIIADLRRQLDHSARAAAPPARPEAATDYRAVDWAKYQRGKRAMADAIAAASQLQRRVEACDVHADAHDSPLPVSAADLRAQLAGATKSLRQLARGATDSDDVAVILEAGGATAPNHSLVPVALRARARVALADLDARELRRHLSLARRDCSAARAVDVALRKRLAATERICVTQAALLRCHASAAAAMLPPSGLFSIEGGGVEDGDALPEDDSKEGLWHHLPHVLQAHALLPPIAPVRPPSARSTMLSSAGSDLSTALTVASLVADDVSDPWVAEDDTTSVAPRQPAAVRRTRLEVPMASNATALSGGQIPCDRRGEVLRKTNAKRTLPAVALGSKGVRRASSVIQDPSPFALAIAASPYAAHPRAARGPRLAHVV